MCNFKTLEFHENKADHFDKAARIKELMKLANCTFGKAPLMLEVIYRF